MNKRILIIDDQQEILESLENLLTGKESLKELTSKLDDIVKEFFGEDYLNEKNINEIYEVNTADRGEKGYEYVRKSIEQNRPYSVVTIDMRMPGWDGLKTATEIRKIDKNIEIVIVTAYTDKNREEIIKSVGTPEKLLYLKKPFDREEIMQLVLSLTLKWSLEREVMEQLDIITENKNRLENIINGINEIEKINPPVLINTISEILKQFLFLLKIEKGMIRMYEGDNFYDYYHLMYEIDENELKQLKKECDTHKKMYNNDKYWIIPFIMEEKIIAMIVMKKNNDKICENENETCKLLEIFISNTSNIIKNSMLYKKLEDKNKELSKQNEELIRMNNLYKKFMVISSHELRTPATLISGYTNILKEKLYKNQEDEKKIYSGLIKSSERLNRLVSRILESFSLSNKGEEIIFLKQNYTIDEIYEDLYTKVSVFLKMRNQEMILEKEENIPKVFVDKEKIVDFVLFNLVINAIKSSEDNRKIIIKAEKNEKNNKVLISVIDEGIGIDEKDLDDIYAPFFVTGNEKYHHTGLYEYKAAGIGLGLTVVKDMLNLIGENIKCETSKNIGTKFTFTLPIE